MKINREASRRADCTPHDSLDGALANRGVQEGPKRGVECDRVNDVLVKDLGRNLTINVAKQVDVNQISDLGKPGALSNALRKRCGHS